MRSQKRRIKSSGILRKRLPENLPEDLIVYHSYVLTNNFKLNFPLLDSETIIRLNHYFAEAGLFYPWHCKQIIDHCREFNKPEIKKQCKEIFPEMFPWGAGQHPIAVPEVVKDWGCVELSTLEREIESFDKLKTEIAKEKIMTETETTEVQVENDNQPQADLSNLTLANYKEVTGKRFRLTKDEKALVESGEETRESIFERRKANGQLSV